VEVLLLAGCGWGSGRVEVAWTKPPKPRLEPRPEPPKPRLELRPEPPKPTREGRTRASQPVWGFSSFTTARRQLRGRREDSLAWSTRISFISERIVG